MAQLEGHLELEARRGGGAAASGHGAAISGRNKPPKKPSRPKSGKMREPKRTCPKCLELIKASWFDVSSV